MTPHWPDASRITLEDWGPSRNVVAGAPHLWGKVLHRGETTDCGLWSCTPGQRRVTIPEAEFCIFLSGQGRYIADDGEEIAIRPGTAIYFRKGWSGLCIVTETVTKAYMSCEETP